jgi:hypothetical protein
MTRFLRIALKVVKKNYGEFLDVTLLYKAYDRKVLNWGREALTG